MFKDFLLLVAALFFLLGMIGSVLWYFAIVFSVKVPSAFEKAPSVVLISLTVICLINLLRKD